MGPELDLRPQLERLDRLILRSEGLAPSALSFAFRPLWQLDAPAKAALALSKAQATQVYAGLGLWPAAVTARLVEAQLVQDGTYPNAGAVFAEAGAAEPASVAPTFDFDPAQPRGPDGQWTSGGGAPDGRLTLAAFHEHERRRKERHRKARERKHEREEKKRRGASERDDPHEVGRSPSQPDDPPSARTASTEPADTPTTTPNAPPSPSERAPVTPKQEPEPFPVRGPDKPDPRAGQKLDNALSDYQTRRYTIDNQTFQLDKAECVISWNDIL